MIGETNKSSRLYVRNINYQYMMIMSLDLVKLQTANPLYFKIPPAQKCQGETSHDLLCVSNPSRVGLRTKPSSEKVNCMSYLMCSFIYSPFSRRGSGKSKSFIRGKYRGRGKKPQVNAQKGSFWYVRLIIHTSHYLDWDLGWGVHWACQYLWKFPKL